MNNKYALLLFLVVAGSALTATPPSGGIRETVGPMTVTLPAAWERQMQPDGTVRFAITSPGSADSSEVQFSSVAVPGAEHGTVHKAVWNEMLRQVQTPSQQQSGQLDRFIWSEMEAFDPSESRRISYRLYTTQEAMTYLVILVAASSPQAFRAQVATMQDALSKAQFAGTPNPGQVNANAARAPAGVANDVPIVESQVHVDIRSFSLGSNVTTDHILFFQNGIVVRTGVINGPRECYALLPVANLGTLPFNYGRWREDRATRTLDIAWQEGPPWRLQRDGDRFSLDGKKLLKLRPIDGARFDGIYAYQPVGDPPSLLALTADGKFEARNLKDSMLCQTGQAAQKEGAGTYEVRKWTLILHFGNGGMAMLPLKIDDDQNLQRAGKFTVGSYEFLPVR